MELVLLGGGVVALHGLILYNRWPDMEGGVIVLGVVVSIWQGIVL